MFAPATIRIRIAGSCPSVGEWQGCTWCRYSADGVYKGLGLRETRQTPHLASPASQMSEVDGDDACGCLVLPTFFVGFWEIPPMGHDGSEMGRDEGLRRAREPRKEVSPPPLKPAKTLHHAPPTGVPAAHRPTTAPLPLARVEILQPLQRLAAGPLRRAIIACVALQKSQWG